MCRLCYWAVLLIFSQQAIGQNLMATIDSYNAHDAFEWRGFTGWEDGLLEKFIQYCDKTEELGLERLSIQASTLDEGHKIKLSQKLSFVDLNDDKLLDVIYAGPHSGEGLVVHIYIQQQGSFKRVFSGMQSIFRVEWKDEKLNKLFINDWGCCADPLLKRGLFQITYDDRNLPQFEKIFATEEIRHEITKPKSYFKKSIRFSVDNDAYRLRLSPEIDNITPLYLFETKGNTMLRLAKGTTGTAYASKQDETGRMWWYVSIDPPVIHTEPIVPFDSSAHLIGWLSSRYVSKFDHN